MSKTKDNIILFIAQGAYSGRLPKAPGTAGTAAGVLLYLALRDTTLAWYTITTIAVTVLGTWAAGEADRILGTKDSPSIVIDEIAGYLVTMFLVPSAWWTIIVGFVLFRYFDILKPWPLKRLQHISGGPGVMLDDLGAGVYANVGLQVALLVSGF